MLGPTNGVDCSNQKFSSSVYNNEKLSMDAQKESTFVDVGENADSFEGELVVVCAFELASGNRFTNKRNLLSAKALIFRQNF